MEVSRVPPHDLDAERALLGAGLLNNEAFQSHVPADTFYSSGHRLVWDVMAELIERGTPADQITVSERLRANGLLKKAGGAAYVSSLTNDVPSIDAAEYYAEIVLEHAARRKLIWSATEAAAAGYDGAKSLEEITADLFASVHGLTPGRDAAVSAREASPKLLAELERLHTGEASNGVSTGYIDMDRRSLLYPGDLIVLGGRPGMGKTGFALDVALHVARGGRRVLIHTLEMPERQVTARLTSKLSGVDGSKFRTANFRDHEWPKVTRALGVLQNLPVDIDDTPAVSSGYIRAQAERNRRAGRLGLVVVDYLQLMEEPGKWDGRERLMIGRITRSLKRLAKELEVPVILLSQLSREVEKRRPPRPQLSDLRESGEIEQDADAVWLLFRPEYYQRENTPEGLQGVGFCQIEKSREGETGDIKLTWIPHLTSYQDIRRS